MTCVAIKAMRAANYNPDKIPRWPVWAMPKIDGFRGLNQCGQFTARTMKKFKNVFTTEYWSKPIYHGLDGELAAERETHPDLCRLTNTATGTIAGTPYTMWHLFDYVTQETRHLPYKTRRILLEERFAQIKDAGMGSRLKLVPFIVCNNYTELMNAHGEFMDMGYEGTCFWDPESAHKEGKSSPKHGGCLRIKDFVDTEAEVLEIVEGEENLNEAQINELGRTFRSSHQANKVPNGMVGTLICRQIEDVFDPLDETKLLIPKDTIINVSPGKMTHDERKYYMAHPEEIKGEIIKHKFFPRGIKDKPRFSNFQSLRQREDLFTD